MDCAIGVFDLNGAARLEREKLFGGKLQRILCARWPNEKSGEQNSKKQGRPVHSLGVVTQQSAAVERDSPVDAAIANVRLKAVA
jgi:hypothetical protein